MNCKLRENEWSEQEAGSGWNYIPEVLQRTFPGVQPQTFQVQRLLHVADDHHKISTHERRALVPLDRGIHRITHLVGFSRDQLAEHAVNSHEEYVTNGNGKAIGKSLQWSWIQALRNCRRNWISESPKMDLNSPEWSQIHSSSKRTRRARDKRRESRTSLQPPASRSWGSLDGEPLPRRFSYGTIRPSWNGDHHREAQTAASQLTSIRGERVSIANPSSTRRRKRKLQRKKYFPLKIWLQLVS